MVTTNPASATIFRKETEDFSNRTGDVRYLFIGKNKSTGEPVDGHVDATNEAKVLETLAQQGIVATKVKPDPSQSKQGAKMPSTAVAPSASFKASAPNAFVPSPREEDVAVVLDRDKIRRNVAAALDHALAMSFARSEGPMQIRARVANAIHGLFKDYKNISSEAPVDHSGAMQDQLSKLSEAIARTEKMLSGWSKYGPPRGGGGGEGGGKKRHSKLARHEGPDAVLKEIFQANLDLMRSIEAGLTQNKA